MANGMVMGGKPSNRNGSGWEVATVNVPSLSGNLYNSEDFSYYGTKATFEILFPITFQTRTFSNRSELMQATGGLQNIVLGSNMSGILVAKGRVYWEYIDVFQEDVNKLTDPFTLYIFVRFVD